jgi:alpha-1,2-mannosyltransferase
MIFSYVLLCSRLVWSFHEAFYNPVGWFFSNSYVWISIALLAALPIRQGALRPGEATPARDAPPSQPGADDDVDRALALPRSA